MFKTIFQRLFWTTTAIIFFVVMIASATMLGMLNQYVANERLNAAREASYSIEYLTTAIAMDRFDSINKKVYESTLMAWSRMVKADITVINNSGNEFASTNSKNAVPDKFIKKVLSGETVRTNLYLDALGSRAYIIGIPIHYGESVMGGIFYFYRPGIMKSTIREFSFMIFTSLIMAMLLSMCFVFIESKRISKPLKEMNQAVLEIASGKFDKRININSGDEMSQLASSFNYMADSLMRLEEMRSSFISDISHELRTPMTSISGFVQGILDGTIPKEKEREYLQIVLDESNRLARLTSEMFEMTKMTSPEYKLSMKEFDINEMVRLCIISAEQKIEDKSLELDVWFENDTEMVLADPDAIKRVIINLLDNAIKFSYPESTINIRVFEKNKKVNMDITNYGVGIAKEDLPHIFDRFYKSDRSRGRDKSGAGLGLSFVKNILNLHSQKITVSSVGAEGGKMKTTFSFTLEKA